VATCSRVIGLHRQRASGTSGLHLGLALWFAPLYGYGVHDQPLFGSPHSKSFSASVQLRRCEAFAVGVGRVKGG
jgi:hypothetical protein